MIYECYRCAAILPAGARACPKCGDAFDAPVPSDAVMPWREFRTGRPGTVSAPPRRPFRKRQIYPVLLVVTAFIAMVTAGVSATRLDLPNITPAERQRSRIQAPPLSFVPVARLSPNQLSAQAALSLVRNENDKYWLAAKQGVDESALRPASSDRSAPGGSIRSSTVWRGPRGRHEIALTFDDGPHAAFTPQLLKILEANGVHATFFVVGEKAEEYPALIRAEVADGDSVGNHTYNHVSLDKIPPAYVATEIKADGDIVQSITGKKPTLFRPPGGDYDPAVEETAQALGYRMVLCSDNPGDYDEPGTQVIETRTLNSIDDGGIILLHDGSRQTLLVLSDLIVRLKAKGYHFVTVDQMLASDAPKTPLLQ